MSMQKTKRKSDATYWMRNEEHPSINPSVFVKDRYGRVTMFIVSCGRLYIEYDYDVPLNTTHYSGGCIQASKAAFMKHVKAIQAKYGVKFSIKTEWGTNASQSSDT